VHSDLSLVANEHQQMTAMERIALGPKLADQRLRCADGNVGNRAEQFVHRGDATDRTRPLLYVTLFWEVRERRQPLAPLSALPPNVTKRLIQAESVCLLRRR
jgi:hypothetical protein